MSSTRAAKTRTTWAPTPTCLRARVDDAASTERHYIVRKSCGGSATALVRRAEHSFIHSAWTEKERAKNFFALETLRSAVRAPRQPFFAWEACKRPQHVDPFASSASKALCHEEAAP